MFESLAGGAAASASLVAVAAFVFSISKSARLTRSATVVREAMSVLPTDSMQRQVLEQLHLELTSQIVARQLIPSWRFVWPFVAWVYTAAIAFQTSYTSVPYLIETKEFSYGEYSTRVLGDPLAPLYLPALFFGALPWALIAYRNAHLGRAAAALNFFSGKPVERRPAQDHLEALVRDPSQKSHHTEAPVDDVIEIKWSGFVAARSILMSVVPGLLVAALGFLAGMLVALNRIDMTYSDALEQLFPLPGIAIIVFSLSAAATLFVFGDIRFELQRLGLPMRYPEVGRMVAANATAGAGADEADVNAATEGINVDRGHD